MMSSPRKWWQDKRRARQRNKRIRYDRRHPTFRQDAKEAVKDSSESAVEAVISRRQTGTLLRRSDDSGPGFFSSAGHLAGEVAEAIGHAIVGLIKLPFRILGAILEAVFD